jgi:PleD family two-component response regulator
MKKGISLMSRPFGAFYDGEKLFSLKKSLKMVFDHSKEKYHLAEDSNHAILRKTDCPLFFVLPRRHESMGKSLAVPAMVLVSDPDTSFQEVLLVYLQPRYQVITANSLAATMQMIIRYRPTILLLELTQPDGDGIELIRQVQSDPGLQDMIIVCVTDRCGVRDKVTALQSGADDYLVKPINPNTFSARLTLLGRLKGLPSWRSPEYR